MSAPSPSPAGAALRSLLLPGWGQWALGQTGRGALIALGALPTACLCGFFNLFAAVDAWSLARKAGRGEVIGPYESGGLADLLADLFG